MSLFAGKDGFWELHPFLAATLAPAPTPAPAPASPPVETHRHPTLVLGAILWFVNLVDFLIPSQICKELCFGKSGSLSGGTSHLVLVWRFRLVQLRLSPCLWFCRKCLSSNSSGLVCAGLELVVPTIPMVPVIKDAILFSKNILSSLALSVQPLTRFQFQTQPHETGWPGRRSWTSAAAVVVSEKSQALTLLC